MRRPGPDGHILLLEGGLFGTNEQFTGATPFASRRDVEARPDDDEIVWARS